MTSAFNHIALFTRAPIPGHCKTRLIPALGADGAAALHEQLTRRQLQTFWELYGQGEPIAGSLWSSGEPISHVAARYGSNLDIRDQGQGDLGDRMARAFATLFAEGARKVVLIGTDLPGIDAAYLQDAFAALDKADVVFGPATDGGYGLIGLNAAQPGLFSGIAWSTSKVLAQSEAAALRLGLSSQRLDPRADIDEPEDLVHLPSDPVQPREVVSLIIPTLNEAANLPATLAAARAFSLDVEVIVSDGGSTDGTVDLARRLGCLVTQTQSGRGAQLNAGAALATQPNLLFLHADTRLPLGWSAAATELNQPGVALVAYPLALDIQASWARLVAWGANWRSRLLSLPYGDQGLLIRKADFDVLGGFQTLPIMEDYDLVRRARRLGRVLLSRWGPAVTSARRWQQRGILRTTAINQAMLLGHAIGLDPERLARFYRARKG
jgi:uncharacterized protein